MRIRPVFIYFLLFTIGLFVFFQGYDLHRANQPIAQDVIEHNKMQDLPSELDLDGLMAIAKEYNIIIQRLNYDQVAGSYNINALGEASNLLTFLTELEEQQPIDHLVCTLDQDKKQWRADFVVVGEPQSINMIYGR